MSPVLGREYVIVSDVTSGLEFEVGRVGAFLLFSRSLYPWSMIMGWFDGWVGLELVWITIG